MWITLLTAIVLLVFIFAGYGFEPGLLGAVACVSAFAAGFVLATTKAIEHFKAER